MGNPISSRFDAAAFQAETGWEFQLRSDARGVELEVLTRGVTQEAIVAALQAHDPDRLRRPREQARVAAITQLSATTDGRAVLVLHGITPSVSTLLGVSGRAL